MGLLFDEVNQAAIKRSDAIGRASFFHHPPLPGDDRLRTGGGNLGIDMIQITLVAAGDVARDEVADPSGLGDLAAGLGGEVTRALRLDTIAG